MLVMSTRICRKRFPTYLRRTDAHLVELLLVVRARLCAVVGHEDQLLA